MDLLMLIPLKGIGRMKLEEELTNKLEFLKNAREKLENISKDDEEHEAHEDFGKASEEHEWTFSCEYRLKPEQPWAQEGAELIEKIRQDIDELTKIQEEINEELRSKRADEDEEDHEEYEDKRIKIMCEMAELLESMMAEDKNSKDNKIVPADRAEREYSVRLYGNVYERGYLEQVDYYKGAGSNRGIIGAFFQAVGMILSEAERKPIKSYIINVKDSAIESIEISDDENERALALAIAKALLSVYVRGQLRPLSEKEIKEEDKKDDKSEKRTGAEDFVFGEVVEGTKKGKTLEKIYQQDADWCKLLIKIIKKRFYYNKI